MQNLLDKFEPTMLCPECEVIRTNRSRHCSICNRCIERFDHHCPWINNCVGVHNHNVFVFFLLFTAFSLGTIILCLSLSEFMKPPDSLQPHSRLDMGHYPVLLDMTDKQFVFPKILPDECFSRHVQLIVKIVVLVVCTLFFLPLLLLTYVQLSNFSSNQTTNERFSRRPNEAQQPLSPHRKMSADYDEESQRTESLTGSTMDTSSPVHFHNGHSRRCCKCSVISNCAEMCCNHHMNDQNLMFQRQIPK